VGNKPKAIEEYVGCVNSGDKGVSIARMKSPCGVGEPGQRPEFEEITVVLGYSSFRTCVSLDKQNA
jgi:hypothetical protein